MAYDHPEYADALETQFNPANAYVSTKKSDNPIQVDCFYYVLTGDDRPMAGILDGMHIRFVGYRRLKESEASSQWHTQCVSSEHERMIPIIHGEQCTGCGQCVDVCSPRALFLQAGRVALQQEFCDACGLCAVECPADAIQIPLSTSQE